jgi:hypothetical protein
MNKRQRKKQFKKALGTFWHPGMKWDLPALRKKLMEPNGRRLRRLPRVWGVYLEMSENPDELG